MTYYDVMASTDTTYSYAQMKKGDSYLYSTYGVKGLTSIKVTFKTSNVLKLYTSDSSTFSGTATTLTSGTAVSVSQNYFKLAAGSNAAFIASIVLTYTCDGASPSTSSSSASVPSSSSSSSSSTSVASSSTSASMDNYYKVADSTSTITDSFNYKALNNTSYCDTISPNGAVKLLVLPIELTGYAFSSQTLTDLNTALNGNGVTDTGYWESLASFYKKSSFGKFTPSYTVASKYVTGLTPAQLYAKNTSDGAASSGILEKAVTNYKSVTGDSCTQFDHDGDGLIDAVIMVYSCPNYNSSKDTSIGKIDAKGDVFWAYCYWDFDNYANASKTSPIGLNYFWMSYDFLYEEATSPNVDAHTLIHESGHLMGLDDYYCYDKKTVGSSTVRPAPMGGVDMMDENVTDHDAFSKLALNWTKPYVVTGNSRITLNPAESSGDCILIPAKGSTWNGTAFDEYLLLELYTPTGLNELDSTTKYSYDTQGYTLPGIRLMHVDARVAKYTVDNSGNVTGTSYVSSPSAALDSDYSYGVPQSNTPSRRATGEAKTKGYNLISLIQAGYPSNTLANGANKGENANLFHAGQSFNFSTYAAFFAKSTTLDNGKAFGYTIAVESCSATSATIAITAV